MNVRITPGKLKGTIDAIPSKSHAHRILIAQKLSQLQGNSPQLPLDIPTFSKDIEATKACLAQLDCDIPVMDCHESGSTLRFMLPVTMALKTQASFEGAGKLPERPISPLKEEMESHGCIFEKNGNPSVSHICTIKGKLSPGEYSIAGNISSQFITGLLFALPLLDGNSTIHLTTKLESAGYVDLTLSVLEAFGIVIEETVNDKGLITYFIAGNQHYTEPENLFVEGDWSNASFWLACGALGGDITVNGLSVNSTQRDKEIVSILNEMGAKVNIGNGIRVYADNQLKSTNTDVTQIPDMVPVLAALMALSDGCSIITGAERLRIKESDRLMTVSDYLSSLGADIICMDDGLSISGKPLLTGGTVKSHNDHRIAMAAAVASCLCNSPVTILNTEAVNKSYPNFFKDFISLGGIVEEI